MSDNTAWIIAFALILAYFVASDYINRGGKR